MSPGILLSLFVLASATGDVVPESRQETPPDTLSVQVPSQEIPPDSLLERETEEAAPVTETQAEADQRLREGLAATFDRIPGLEGVDVRVEAGVVFLSGTVLSSGDQALADSLAMQTPGVLYVDDRIAEETSVSMRLRPLLQTAEGKLYLWLSYLPLLLLAVALALFFLGLARLVYRWDALFDRVSRNPFLRNLIRQIVGGSVGLLGVLLALELLDATALVGAVLGAAGVVGIAMGFAFRNIAENYLAGIILSLRQPFSPDDHVLVEGQEGRVLRLTSRETLLMTLDGNHLRIPNATIFNSVVQNLTRNPLRRFRFDLSVGQSEDLSRVMELARATLLDMEGVLNDPPPWAIVSEVGDSWVLLRFFGWVDQRDVAFEKARSEAIRLTKEAFDAAGIAMPAPEYGLRLLGAEPGVKIEVEVPTAQAGPVVETDRIDQPPESPVPIQVDLGPDRALDEQIARDREEAKDRDLLEPTN